MRRLIVDYSDRDLYIMADEAYDTYDGRKGLDCSNSDDCPALEFGIRAGRFEHLFSLSDDKDLTALQTWFTEHYTDERFAAPTLGLNGVTLSEILQKLIDNRLGAQ